MAKVTCPEAADKELLGGEQGAASSPGRLEGHPGWSWVALCCALAYLLSR